jgi:sugar phosphate isomerase/epimerase
MNMDRRGFLKRIAAAPVLAEAGRVLAAARRDPLERIGVTTWSVHNYFPKTRDRKLAGEAPTIRLPEFFALAAGKWGLRNFELVNNHFESTEPAFLEEVRQAVRQQDGRLYNMCVDLAGTNLSEDDEAKRQASVEGVKKWIDVAASIGCPSIRCNTGQSPRGEAVDKTIASYKDLAAYSGPRKVRVIIENHGGVSYIPEKIVEIMKGVGGPWIGTLPDFGNWPSEEVRYRALEMVFPYARVCHAKGLNFTAAGEVTDFDFPRCVRIAEKSGFKGIYSIEYEGPEDPMTAVPKIIALLKRELS